MFLAQSWSYEGTKDAKVGLVSNLESPWQSILFFIRGLCPVSVPFLRIELLIADEYNLG